MATISLAWKPEDLFVEFRPPQGKSMGQFEQDYNANCEVLPHSGGKVKTYFIRGRFDGSDPQNIAHGACLSDTGDGTYEQLTKEACNRVGCTIIMVDQ
ncbi:hypothetical protein IAT40_001522 [Kwoniella sp. CBS 6097]